MNIIRIGVLLSATALAGCFQNDNHDEEEAASAVNQRSALTYTSTAPTQTAAVPTATAQ